MEVGQLAACCRGLDFEEVYRNFEAIETVGEVLGALHKLVSVDCVYSLDVGRGCGVECEPGRGVHLGL